jgi:hypothetical protein
MKRCTAGVPSAVIIVLQLMCTVALAGEPAVKIGAPPENPYVWKNADVLRFEYSKTITVKQPDADGKVVEQTTDVSAVLILEIKEVTPARVSAILRFDSPHVTLPELTMYLAQSEKPEVQAGKSKTNARAIEVAMKTARWSVVLAPNGMIHIDSRSPGSTREWLREAETTATWRKKPINDLLKVIEQDVGLRVPANDRDIFVYTGSAEMPPAKGTDGLKPQRADVRISAKEDDKTTVTFTRKAPAEKLLYSVPGLLQDEKIEIALKNVANHEGKAVFDHRLGMLDTLDEDYAATLDYNYKGVGTLEQEVRVKYRLRRLAPAITSR